MAMVATNRFRLAVVKDLPSQILPVRMMTRTDRCEVVRVVDQILGFPARVDVVNMQTTQTRRTQQAADRATVTVPV